VLYNGVLILRRLAIIYL